MSVFMYVFIKLECVSLASLSNLVLSLQVRPEPTHVKQLSSALL